MIYTYDHKTKRYFQPYVEENCITGSTAIGGD